MTNANNAYLELGSEPGAVKFALQTLVKHIGFFGGSGSGKTTAAQNVIEQVTQDFGVPVIILDRKGDLSGYGGFPDVPPSQRAQWERFFAKVEPHVYTPGHPSGRPLQVQLLPDKIREMDLVDRENAAHQSAHALADMLGYKDKGKDAQARAMLFQALRMMLQIKDQEINIMTLMLYISQKSEKFLRQVAMLNLDLLNKLVQDLSTFMLDKGRVLLQPGEPLSMESLLGLNGGKGSRTRISIVSTKFLPDNAALFFASQLFIEAARWASKNPSPTLQAMIFCDEADLYAPARGTSATREPLLNLFKRGRSAGLAVALGSQTPGDVDYKARDNMGTMWVGALKEKVAIDKVAGRIQDDELRHEVPFLKTGEAVLVSDGRALRINGRASMLKTVQLSEDQILALAHAGPPSASEMAARIRARRAKEAASE